MWAHTGTGKGRCRFVIFGENAGVSRAGQHNAGAFAVHIIQRRAYSGSTGRRTNLQ
jgi:hypothetical protein